MRNRLGSTSPTIAVAALGMSSFALGCAEEHVEEEMVSHYETALISASFAEYAENPLKIQATVPVNTSSPVTLRIYEAGDKLPFFQQTKKRTGQESALTFDLYGLKPDTRYRATLGAHAGNSLSKTFTTRSVPSSVPTVVTQGYEPAVGSATRGATYVLFNFNNLSGDDSLVIVDENGVVRWYLTSTELGHSVGDTESTNNIDAFSYSEETGHLYVIRDQREVVELDLMGRLVQTFSPPDGFYISHEVLHANGSVFAVGSSEQAVDGRQYVVDSVLRWNQAGQMTDSFSNLDLGYRPATFPRASWVGPGASAFWEDQFPGAIDWLHTNALGYRNVLGSEKILISLRYRNQVAQVDLASHNVDWLLGDSGDNSDPNGSPYFSLASDSQESGWFSGQHNPHLGDDGQLLLFDNANGTTQHSRVLKMGFDESTYVASTTKDAYFSTPDFCSAFGAVEETSQGTLLGTCGTNQRVVEFNSSGERIWDMSISLPSGSGTHVYRASLFPGFQ